MFINELRSRAPMPYGYVGARCMCENFMHDDSCLFRKSFCLIFEHIHHQLQSDIHNEPIRLYGTPNNILMNDHFSVKILTTKIYHSRQTRDFFFWNSKSRIYCGGGKKCCAGVRKAHDRRFSRNLSQPPSVMKHSCDKIVRIWYCF